MLKSLFIVCVMLCSYGNAKLSKHLYLDSPEYIGGAGMFHNFNIVLGCLDLYDRYDHLALTVDFKTAGLYYEAEQGPNWWSYYFEPIDYLPKSGAVGRSITKHFKNEEKGGLGNAVQFYMTRDRAHELIMRYIHIRPEIIEEVEQLYRDHLANAYVIGVHYRGTDKRMEAELVSYDEAIEAIKKHIDHSGYKIFVATDEPNFLKRVEEEFPNRVYATDAQRMQDSPIHYASNKRFLQGKEALIDCLLLAKSDLLIRTNSNLSAVAAYFNPHMPVISLNTLNHELYEGASRKGILNELNRRP